MNLLTSWEDTAKNMRAFKATDRHWLGKFNFLFRPIGYYNISSALMMQYYKVDL